MPVRLARLLPALALVALLAAPAGALGAKTRTLPAQQFISFSVRGTNGWRLDIDADAGGEFKRPTISVDATGPRRLATVSYGVHGHVTAAGAIDARLPGIGRISVVFEKTMTEKNELLPEPGCRKIGEARTYKGTFRGTIKLRGRGGFTAGGRSSAHGEILEIPKLVCAVKRRRPTPAEERLTRESLSHVTELRIGRKLLGGELSFQASYRDPSERSLPGHHAINFRASYIKKRHGMTTAIDVTATGGGRPHAFTFAAPNGEPSEATVEPPAPFAGTAAFKLESPTTASWTGDLRVAMPTLGEVSLTGPSFWKTLCEGTACTNTLPPGVQLLFSLGTSNNR